jgi:hypothetical protein
MWTQKRGAIGQNRGVLMPKQDGRAVFVNLKNRRFCNEWYAIVSEREG